MEITALSFLWLFISSMIMGIFICSVLPEGCGEYYDLDLVLIVGVMGLTVYAEVFSLFHRVGFLAVVVLLLGEVIILWVRRSAVKHYVLQMNVINKSGIKAVVLTLMILFFAAVATQEPTHYDTYLYHAQAIEWIEKYGVVAGLGNLHNRFAYNSAFLCLQALFSWKSVLGQSLHGMNAYLGMIMAVYAVFTFSPLKKESFKTSDLLNLLLLFYIMTSLETMSSPNTDLLPMMIVVYVLSKWMRYTEQNVIKDYEGILCLIAVYGITVKLSILPLALLAVKPVFTYLKKRDWRKLCFYAVMALVIVLPFMIRNVVISGYLLYPYAQLDLFDVDWKMPAYTVIRDNHEIMAWGRGLRDVNRYSEPFSVWFPVWFTELRMTEKLLFYLNIPCLAETVIFILWVCKDKRSQYSDSVLLKSVSAAGLLMWLFTAPLIRYGLVYLFLLPAFEVGFWIRKYVREINRLILLLTGTVIGYGIAGYLNRSIPLQYPRPYGEYECVENEFQNGVVIWSPKRGDQTGYLNFPATPYAGQLERIEMRGDNLADGFRIKANNK